MNITVQYLKYPDARHWRHDMVWLGKDEYGIWLGAPPGSTIQRGDEPAISWEEPFVQLVAPDQWWTMIYNGDHRRTRLYVDIVTPPVWLRDDRVEMIDLDLDVVRYQDGTVEVLDEDEFEDHRHALGYPDWMIERALGVTADVKTALEQSREPFGEGALAWMAKLVSSRR